MKWEFCPYCKGELETKTKNSQLCSECGKVLYQNPKATVGILLVDKDNRLILAIRGIEPLKGYWDCIGGYVDVGESLEEALKRELQEETGLVLGRDTTPYEYLSSAYIDITFMEYWVPVNTILFIAKLKDKEPIASDDISGFVYITENDYQPEKMAWSESMTPLVHKGFEWIKKVSSSNS